MREMSGAGSAQARAEVGEARAGAAAAVKLRLGVRPPCPGSCGGPGAEREPGARAARARSDGAREAEALPGLRVGSTASAQVQGTGRDGPGGASAAPGGPSWLREGAGLIRGKLLAPPHLCLPCPLFLLCPRTSRRLVSCFARGKLVLISHSSRVLLPEAVERY